MRRSRCEPPRGKATGSRQKAAAKRGHLPLGPCGRRFGHLPLATGDSEPPRTPTRRAAKAAPRDMTPKGLNLGPVRGQPGSGPRSTWVGSVLNPGRHSGQPDLGVGSTWARSRLNLGRPQDRPGSSIRNPKSKMARCLFPVASPQWPVASGLFPHCPLPFLGATP